MTVVIIVIITSGTSDGGTKTAAEEVGDARVRLHLPPPIATLLPSPRTLIEEEEESTGGEAETKTRM